jgi:integrase
MECGESTRLDRYQTSQSGTREGETVAPHDTANLVTGETRLSAPVGRLLATMPLHAIIGLLAATGMRVGEAIRLDRPDFDSGTGVLTIRNSKFGKSRLVPLHLTTTAALAGYLRLRDELHPGHSDPAVFISPTGTRLDYCNVHATWRLLVRRAGLTPWSPNCRPRPHDLRHYADGWVMCPAVTFPLAGAAELVLQSA